MDTRASDPSPSPAAPIAARRSSTWKLVLGIVGVLLVVYLVTAYLIVPAIWVRYVNKHPALVDLPDITHTKKGIPGDPINVALIGTEVELKSIMIAAKWYPADALTFDSCIGIALASVFKRPDPDAPVSNLYFWGRKQDLAFEHQVDNNPRQRHHVRFWKSAELDSDGRPLWVGSAVYDERVGLSKTTGQVTHVTAPDIDAERDKLFHDLAETGDLVTSYFIDDFHTIRKGRNGGGDPWYTDGRLEVGVIKLSGWPK